MTSCNFSLEQLLELVRPVINVQQALLPKIPIELVFYTGTGDIFVPKSSYCTSCAERKESKPCEFKICSSSVFTVTGLPVVVKQMRYHCQNPLSTSQPTNTSRQFRKEIEDSGAQDKVPNLAT